MNRTLPENPMNPNTVNAAALVGRILLALIFITSGFEKLMGFSGTVGYIASKGLPLPQVGAALAVLVELGGGLMLAIGFKARWAALAIAIFSLAAGFLFHDFWNADAASKMMQSINFWKNVSIAGGMLMVFAFGPGRYSVDKS
jgi:putative oxidoreductase